MTPIPLESKKDSIFFLFFNISIIEQGETQALRVSMVTHVVTCFDKVRLSLISIASLIKL